MKKKVSKPELPKPAFIQVVYSPRATEEESGWMWRLYDTEANIIGGGDFEEGHENRLFTKEEVMAWANTASKHYGGVPIR